MQIVLNTQKGGAGKTTLAVHLAVWLAERGRDVTLLDSDNQGASARWVRQAEPKVRVVGSQDAEQIGRIADICEKHNTVLVSDTPPGLGDAVRVLLRRADVIAVPLVPSAIDLVATQQGLDLIQRLSDAGGGVNHYGKPQRVRVVINRRESALRLGFAVERKARSLDLPAGGVVCENVLAKRGALAKAYAKGSVVWRMTKSDSGAKAAARDLDKLFTELLAPAQAEAIPHPQAA
ncbi:MAG: ParA family protein [Planctomycetota bacterium]